MRKKLVIGFGILTALVLISVVGFVVWRWSRAGSSGLVVQLTSSENSFRLDEPMQFSVVVINASMKTVTRDFQTYCHDIFEITGPDDNPVP